MGFHILQKVNTIIGRQIGDQLSHPQTIVTLHYRDLLIVVEIAEQLLTNKRFGMLQDDDLLHNYTVAKALESLDFSTVDVDSELGFKSALVACTYHCG